MPHARLGKTGTANGSRALASEDGGEDGQAEADKDNRGWLGNLVSEELRVAESPGEQ
jgi:hypothetical protein